MKPEDYVREIFNKVEGHFWSDTTGGSMRAWDLMERMVTQAIAAERNKGADTIEGLGATVRELIAENARLRAALKEVADDSDDRDSAQTARDALEEPQRVEQSATEPAEVALHLLFQPTDIMRAQAISTYLANLEYSHFQTVREAAAIAREECAKIADLAAQCSNSLMADAAQNIAESIRALGARKCTCGTGADWAHELGCEKK